MRRRGNGEGTIRQRFVTNKQTGERKAAGWEAMLTLPDGARKSFYGKTRQQVAMKLAAAQRDRDKGLTIMRDERLTVKRFLESWLQTVRPPRLEQSTWERHEEYVRLHIVPVLGQTILTKLTPQQVQELYAQKLTERSPTTVHHIHATLHRALDSALRLGLVQRNVTELVDAPRMQRQEMNTWTPEQARVFLAVSEGDRLHALYVVALTTGMRQGELLGLKWSEVDLEHGLISVTSTLKRPKTGLTLSARTKTRTSRRRITLTAEAVAALREHRARQLKERLQLGEHWTDYGLVFANPTGDPCLARSIERYSFAPLIHKAGVAKIRFHDLRHTCATLLLLQGVNPKIVSEMLGHSTVAITLDLYSHVTPNMQRGAAAAMSRALWG
jgi:integrase